MRSARSLRIWIGCLAALSLVSASLAADEKEPERILFLHLRIKDNVVSLVKASSRPGVLKKPQHQEGLTLELLSPEGTPLWTAGVEDPGVQRFEYEDPENPGQLLTKIVERPDTEFTVRVPWKKGATHLSVHRHERAPAAAKAPGAPAQAARRHLGRVELPAEETK